MINGCFKRLVTNELAIRNFFNYVNIHNRVIAYNNKYLSFLMDPRAILGLKGGLASWSYRGEIGGGPLKPHKPPKP